MSFTLIIILIAGYSYMQWSLPNVDVLKAIRLQVPLKVFSINGQLIAEFGVKHRIPVALNQIPQTLIDAVLATEDARFYQHDGVDILGLIRAAKAVILTGKKVQGASTITMQVARNFFLTRKKTYLRKIKEILLAIKISHNLSKDKVLALYLNKIYLGYRAYGVEAGAWVYYGKTLNQLTLPQMAMLAGLPQAPSKDNPIDNPKAALERRNHVLERMRDVGYITEATYQKAMKTSMTASYHQHPIQLNAPYVAEMVRQAMVKKYGNKAYELGLNVYTTIQAKDQRAAKKALDDGLIAYSLRHGYRKPQKNLGVFTPQKQQSWQRFLSHVPSISGMHDAAVIELNQQSIRVLLANGQVKKILWPGLSWARPFIKGRKWLGALPKKASDIVKVGDVIMVRRQANGRWVLTQIPKVQGAIISVNPSNGAVLALSGGFDYHLSHFNRVTQAFRQTGSNFKPFIYSAALNKGMTLATIINDAPVVIKEAGENAWWRPHNDNWTFYGPTRLRIGLVKSRNLVSIRLLQAIGIDYALNYLKRFGFNAKQLPHGLSLALGSASITPWQMAKAYSVFANGGYRVNLYLIDHITNQQHQVFFQAKPLIACRHCINALPKSCDSLYKNIAPRMITPQNAYLMTNALKGVIEHGTGRKALVLKRSDLAGKTGTTNRQVDAWFSGFNSSIETSVWVGFDDHQQSLYEYGSKAALPIWINYMRQALKDMPLDAMLEPPGIVRVRIDMKTGLLARPNQKDALFEVFRKEHMPLRYAHHRVDEAPWSF